MKKVIALMLCLLMVVSLAACGSQSAATEESSAPTEQNEQNETVTPPTEETEQPEETSEPEETQAPEPAFDTSWAGDEYVMPIPEPPFAYKISIDGDTVVIRATDGGKDGDVTHDAILDYCEELKNAGFTENLRENEIGERYGRICYEFWANDANGNSVSLLDDGGGVGMGVTLSSSQNETAEQTAANDSVDTEAIGIPALPEGDWNIEEDGYQRYKIYIAEITHSALLEYLDTFDSSDFSCVDQGATDKFEYWIYLNESTGQMIDIAFSGDDSASGSVQITTYYN